MLFVIGLILLALAAILLLVGAIRYGEDSTQIPEGVRWFILLAGVVGVALMAISVLAKIWQVMP